MVRISERDVGEVELAFAFDPHLVRAVHHDLGDPVVVKQVLDRPVAHDLSEHRVLEPQAVGPIHGDMLFVEGSGEVIGDQRPHRLGRCRFDVPTEEARHTCVYAIDELDLAIVSKAAQLEDLGTPIRLRGKGGDGCAERPQLRWFEPRVGAKDRHWRFTSARSLARDAVPPGRSPLARVRGR